MTPYLCILLQHSLHARLQRILGQNSLAMVNEYLQFYSTELRQNIEQFNPLERFRDTKYIVMPKR